VYSAICRYITLTVFFISSKEEKMVDRKLKRRDFLKLTSVAAAGAIAAACAPAAQPQTEPEQPPAAAPSATPVRAEEKAVETVAAPEVSKEPPSLEAMVNSGQLPPVDERLPSDPLVVSGRENGVGVYGGELRMIHFDPVWFVSNYGLNAERLLHYSDADLKTIVPNIFESWEVTPDGKTYTIHMRKGMKWSDGEPLTTEDIRFWWEDIANDADLSSGVGWQWRFGGEKANFEFVDDFTFRVTFANTFGNFPAHLTRWHQGDVVVCAHYLKQFHAKYGDMAEIDRQVAANSQENWGQLFWSKNGWGNGIWQGPENVMEFPTLSPWTVTGMPQEGLYLWSRNPYYWKVDVEGNQLPYIETLRYDYVTNIEANKIKIVQGELDYVGPHDVTIAQYPFYKENEANSNYIVSDYLSCMTDRYTLYPQHNLTEDPVLEALVQDPEHRWVKALSVAIDREEINESLFFGLARTGTIGPMPASKYYKEEYGNAWAQYDPELANQLLDELGLDKRDASGMRLRPDGQVLKYNIEHAGERVGVEVNKWAEMVVNFWREVGIDATTKQIQESLYNERLVNGQIHCGAWHQDRCTDMLLHIEWRWFIPTTQMQGGAAQLWAAWYNAVDKNAEGLVEPPDSIKALFEKHDKVAEVLDENERVALGQEIFDWLAENPLAIGFVTESPAPLLFNKNMRNLPRPKVPVGWDSYGISTYHPEAFYYEGGVRA
jgi:peptide/nickel transport system substrate-binding protein